MLRSWQARLKHIAQWAPRYQKTGTPKFPVIELFGQTENLENTTGAERRKNLCCAEKEFLLALCRFHDLRKNGRAFLYNLLENLSIQLNAMLFEQGDEFAVRKALSFSCRSNL